MPGIAQTLPVPPVGVTKMQMWNAIRVAFVNRNHPGLITYDPLTTPPPKVNLMTMLNAVRLAAGGAPFEGVFDELGSDGTTLRWTAMAGASEYLVEAFGAEDLSGGVLGSGTTAGTSLALSALSLSAGTYWIRVTSIHGALTQVWRDGGLPIAIGSGFTDLVGWSTSSLWVYCRDNPFVVADAGVIQPISPPPWFVVITGGVNWTTGNFPVKGTAKDYVNDPGPLSMLLLDMDPEKPAPDGEGGGVGYLQPYVLPSKQVIFDGNSLLSGYVADPPVKHAMRGAGRKWKSGGNYAVESQTTTDMASDAATQIDVLFDTGLIRNVLFAWEVTNELHNGVLPTTAVANFKAYCAARRAAGFYVIACTVLPRTETGIGFFTEVSRQLCNADLLDPANLGIYWDSVVDTTADPRLEDNTDTNYFNADLVHLTNAGSYIVGDMIGSILNTL